MFSWRGTIKSGRGKGSDECEIATYSTFKKLLRKGENTALHKEEQLNCRHVKMLAERFDLNHYISSLKKMK